MAKEKGKVLTAEDILSLQAEIAQRKAEEAAAAKLEKKRLREEERERVRKEQELQKEADRQAREAERKEQAKEEVKKRKSRSPFAQDTVTATRDEMAHTVHEKYKWFTLGKELGKPQSDEELWNRMCDFWKMCEESGEIPQKQDFYMFCNISPELARAWKSGQGCSRERVEMMQMFESLYSSVRDTLANKKNIDNISYIWQSKQWQGYREPKTELEVTNHNPMQMFPDALAVESQIRKELEQGLVLGDTEVDPKYLANVEVETDGE